MKPQRMQLSRKRGFNLQRESMALNGLPAVKVTRGKGAAGMWGNPFRVGEDHTYYGGPGYEKATAEQCADLFRRYVEAGPYGLPPIETLRGKNLACFCPLPAAGEPDHCHASVLLELANAAVTVPTAAQVKARKRR